MMTARSGKWGFTLAEVTITVAVLVLITIISMGIFPRVERREVLSKQAYVVASVLEEARAATLASKNGFSYNVHFDSQSLTLFRSSTYSVSDPNNEVQALDPMVNLSGWTVPDIFFIRLSGEVANKGSVTLSLVSDPSQTKTITIYQTGLVEVN